MYKLVQLFIHVHIDLYKLIIQMIMQKHKFKQIRH